MSSNPALALPLGWKDSSHQKSLATSSGRTTWPNPREPRDPWTRLLDSYRVNQALPCDSRHSPGSAHAVGSLACYLLFLSYPSYFYRELPLACNMGSWGSTCSFRNNQAEPHNWWERGTLERDVSNLPALSCW
jgi:hypothetical protein